jgi:threonine synthase
MKYVSTRNHKIISDLYDAIFNGMASDGGLFAPESFPLVPDYIHAARKPDLHELAYAMLSGYTSELSADELQTIIQKAFTFPIPLIKLENNIHLLEVFHGPTLAFKDVGARFMANLIEYYMLKSSAHLTILVATSGDTGSAIANAFHHKANIDVCVLYPSGKITELQEKQMTTLGGNIHALEVQGTFDDCQKLVKAALSDMELRKGINLTTANSINLARLLPQSVYHAWGMVQLSTKTDKPPVMTVPCGNFGNLVSAIYAAKMGFPVQSFIAATNINDVFIRYINTGNFLPKSSVMTYSNAMDVGNPSNFERIIHCFKDSYHDIKNFISAVSITDAETLAEIKQTYDRTGYILDPHTAVGVAATRMRKVDGDVPVIVTSTAHPAKFPEVIKLALGFDIELPEPLRVVMGKEKESHVMAADYGDLKRYLMMLR